MRIAYLAPEFIPTNGGVGIYSVGLIRELSKHEDVEIHVITPRKGKGYKKKSIEKSFNNNIKLHWLTNAKDTFFYNLKFQLALFKEFNKLHRKYKFDIVHSANLVHMPDIFLMIMGMKIPHVVTVHTTIGGQLSGIRKSKQRFFDMAFSEKASALTYPVIMALEKLYLKRAKNILTVSRHYADILQNDYGFSGNLHVITNGIDQNVFNHEKTGETHKLDHIKSPIVLFVGRLTVNKGINDLVSAAKKVLSISSDVHFVICGSGESNILLKLLKKNKIP